MAKWLIGARMVGKSVEQTASGGAQWTLEIARDGGYRGWIVWNTQGASELAVPLPWGVRHVRRLTGSRQAFEQPTASIGPEPILLENRPGP